MTVDEYKEKVISLFKSGKATEAQWEEMAIAVLEESERTWGNTDEIDRVIDPDCLIDEE
jgi:hypothetical protein